MNKQVIVLLVVLSLLVIPISISYAGAGIGNSPQWYDCFANNKQVFSSAIGYAGSSTIVVTYAAPSIDGDWFIICANENFHQITFNAQVYNSANQQVATALTDVETTSGNVAYLTLVYGTCSCSGDVYTLQNGDRVDLQISVSYSPIGLFTHNGGYGFYV